MSKNKSTPTFKSVEDYFASKECITKPVVDKIDVIIQDTITKLYGEETMSKLKEFQPPGEFFKDEDQIRVFTSGATRSPLGNKPQYEGYLSPIVIKRFGEYMLKHQIQSNGERRAADNWQLNSGIPKESLMDSSYRHYMDWWLHHRGYDKEAFEPLEEALCGLLFNTMAYLKHVLEERR